MGRIIFLLLISAIGLAGCAGGDSKSKSVNTFYSQNKAMIKSEYDSLMKKKSYDYILHIHFRGNDFGGEAGDEVKKDLAPPKSALLAKSHPFKTLQLRDDEAALDLFFDYKNPQVLGTMRYRHSSRERALRAVDHLFDCSTRTSAKELQDNVMLVISGGSHGAYEAQTFAKDIEDKCGKSPDAILTGDAIAQPMSFAMTKFENVPAGTPCLNFFEQNAFQVIHGQPIEGCVNIKITSGGHDTLQQSGMYFFNDFFADISAR